ncbi:MAG: hypothetical protein QXD64_06610 [Thermoplasmata archaeon]
MPYTINYTPSPYNLHDLNSTKSYVDVEVYGDLKNGYVEFTLWHERLSDLVVYMRPANYPWQISWKVWNTSEAILLMPTVYGSTSHTSNIVLHLPGAQSTMHARWEFRAHFGGANWEVPYKVYLDTITPQNEIKRNWLYLQDINPHTLIFVPQTQVDVRGWAVAHPGITNPSAYDSDQDYLTDWEECMIYFTNPTNGDSDADGFGDCCECIGFVTDPWSYTQDSDGDGMPDEYEEHAAKQGSWQNPTIPNKRVALIVVGGIHPGMEGGNFPWFWNDIIFMWDILHYCWNYKDDDLRGYSQGEEIIVFYADGNVPTITNCEGCALIHDLSYKNPEFTDPIHRKIIDYPATTDSFIQFINTPHPEFDFSFLLLDDHGSLDGNYSTFHLWGEEEISPSDIELWFSPQTGYNRVAIVVEACHSGGFVNYFKDRAIWQFNVYSSSSVSTPSHSTDLWTPETTHAHSSNMYGIPYDALYEREYSEYLYYFMSALRKWTPIWCEEKGFFVSWQNYSNDPFVFLGEAHTWAWERDSINPGYWILLPLSEYPVPPPPPPEGAWYEEVPQKWEGMPMCFL